MYIGPLSQAFMTSTYPILTEYYVDGKADIRKRMDEDYRMSIPQNQQFWQEADIDTRFLCGDQTLWQQLYFSIPINTRRQFQFNHIRTIKNLVEGYQRKNRKTTIVTPIESQDQDTADQLSKCLLWANNQCDFYETLSDAFGGALTTGMNLLSLWMDYREDPINGRPRCDNLSYNNYLIDPSFKKKDLSDANYVWIRKWMSRQQIISLMPERRKDIMSMPLLANRDDKFMYLPENYQFSIQGLLPYDEYWYLDYRTQKLLVDSSNGDTKEWDGDDDSLRDFIAHFPDIRVVEIQKQTVKLAIAVGNNIMYDGPNPCHIDRYPFIPVLGYFTPETPYYSLKIQGLVRGLRDAQYIYNRKLVIMNDLLESQINSGIKFKENALVDPNDAFLSGQGRALALKDSAQMDDVEVIKPPEVPGSMMQLSEMLSEEMSKISGINEELLGQAVDDKAGILSMLRQGAGLTTLQILFDQLDYSQKLCGEIFIEMMQDNFTPAKVERILQQKASDQFYNKMFTKYDCNVEEGMLTTSQKQMQFAQLLHMREMGLPIPDSCIIDAAQIQDKKKLLDAMERQTQQGQEQEQMQSQSAMESQQVVNETLMAKAESDHALAQERLNKLGLDQALNIERMERAQEERDASTLNKIKAIKELETINIDHIQALLNMLQQIQTPVPAPAGAGPQPMR